MMPANYFVIPNITLHSTVDKFKKATDVLQI